MRALCFLLVLATAGFAADDPVFRSDVAMSRVDARVTDRDGRTVTGLLARDFVVRLDGKELPVKNFANENTPIDILLLLDVSGSMEPHVERIASAAQQALRVLADRDRVAIMVFDTRTRVRLPFRSSQSEVTGELKRLLRGESFNGGTRITSAMLDAARYLEREARPDARRAIVILTDDMTQDDADEGRVEAALHKAGAVLSFLQAPYEEPSPGRMPGGGRRPRGTWGNGGGMGWPGSGWPGGGGQGGPMGIPGGRGGGMPGGAERSHSADTETIAHDSGGDTMQVQDAAALEDTLARLRQRYALYFYVPDAASGTRGSLQVALSESASLRYHDAEIESRRVFMAGGATTAVEPATVTRVRSLPPEPSSISSPSSSSGNSSTSARRGRAVNEDSGPVVNSTGNDSVTGAPSSSANSSSAPATPANPPDSPKKGWPRANTPAPPESNRLLSLPTR